MIPHGMIPAAKDKPAVPELHQLQYRQGFDFQTVFESVRKKRAEKYEISCSAMISTFR